MLDRSTPLMAQTTRPGGIHIPYVVSLIKINIFHVFYPKIWKIALRPMETSKSHNSGTFEDTCTLFAPNWGFLGSADRMVSFKCTPKLVIFSVSQNVFLVITYYYYCCLPSVLWCCCFGDRTLASKPLEWALVVHIIGWVTGCSPYANLANQGLLGKWLLKQCVVCAC